MNQQRFTEVFNQLTARRKEVLEKFLAGETDTAIAQSLHIRETTVRKHIEEICRQFDLDNDKLPGEHRPKRENLLRLFAKYKPELLSQRDVKEIATEEETALKFTSVERREGAITELPSENDLDKVVEKVRSHSAVVPQRQEEAQEERSSNSTDFVGREEAIADCTPEKELDELVRRVREKRYSKIQDQCGTLRILDVEQEIAIDDLYIDVNVLEEIPSYKHKKFPELLEGLNPDEINRIGFGRHQERLPGLKAVENYRKLMMLGQPGAGKTTFLQHIAIECNQGSFQANCVPIFIRLREFTEDAKDIGDFRLFNYISHEFACCCISAPQQMLTRLLNDGRALILLDGLDEVPEQDREEVLKQIRKFASDYFSNQFIITCRIAESQSRFKNFTNVEIADFTPEQIEKFAKKWFVYLARKSNRDEQEGFQKATKLMVKLNENERLLELAVTPLLLTLICLVFQHEDDFPTKRSELYEKGMNILLTKWDKDRGIKRDEIYRDLSPYHKIKLLSYVASATFEQSPYYLFEQHTVQGYIADYLGALPDAEPDSEQLFHDSEAVLQAIGVQHGLLIAQAQGIYSFSHRTFQEYFTAKKNFESEDWESWVIHITEARWREVFLLVFEIIKSDNKSSDYLLRLMKDKIDSVIESDKTLKRFLKWVSQKSRSTQLAYRPAGVRAFYLTLEPTNDLSFEDSDDAGNVDAFDWDVYCAIDQYFEAGLDDDVDPNLNLDYCLNFALNFDCNISDFQDYMFDEDKAVTERNTNAPITIHEIEDSLRSLHHYEACSNVSNLYTALIHAEYFALVLDIDPELMLALKQIREQLPEPTNHYAKIFKQWWQDNSSLWNEKLREQLRDVATRYRNFGYKWQFSEEQKKLLERYWEANKLLLDCLDIGCDVSPELELCIVDTLLLPADETGEIEKLIAEQTKLKAMIKLLLIYQMNTVM
jgi:predicted NACHT family NTPase